MRIINFKTNDHPVDAFYDRNKIQKVTDYIKLLNCMFVKKETMVRKLLQLQNKAMRIINFKTNDHPVDAFYDRNKIQKVTDYIKLLNCMFVKNVLARNCLSIFQGTFKLANNVHQHHTRHAVNDSVILK